MNIYTVIARKGDKFESLAISENGRIIKEGFKQIDAACGFDAVYLIDSISGSIRSKKFARVVAPKVEKKTKAKAVKDLIEEIDTPGLDEGQDESQPDFNEPAAE